MKMMSVQRNIGFYILLFASSLSSAPPDANSHKQITKSEIDLENQKKELVTQKKTLAHFDIQELLDLGGELPKEWPFFEKLIHYAEQQSQSTAAEKDSIEKSITFLESLLPTYDIAQHIIKTADFLEIKDTLPCKMLVHYILTLHERNRRHVTNPEEYEKWEKEWYSWAATLSTSMLCLLNKYSWLFFNKKVIIMDEKTLELVFRVSLSELKAYGKFPEITHKTCDLSDCYLGSLEDLTKQVPHDIEVLNLYNNYIYEVPRSAFAGMPNIVTLSLDNSRITSLELGCFDGLPALEQLFLAHNMIKQVTHVLMPLLERKVPLRLLYLYGNELPEDEQEKVVKAIARLQPQLITKESGPGQALAINTLKLVMNPDENTTLKMRLLMKAVMQESLKAQETSGTAS